MNDLIYNQRDIPKDKWRYGLRSSAATGCGWIATYNALRLLGYKVDPEKLITYYESCFPIINGNFGTFISSPVRFFKSKGFKVRTCAKLQSFDEIARESDVCIMFFFWHSKRRFGAHYVTVQYSNGKFYGYNTFSDSDSADNYGESLEKFVRRRKYFMPMLIGIRKPIQACCPESRH